MAAKFLPYLLAGISVGGQYALIAIGYTMVYGILRLINFAHGDIFTVAGFLMVYATASLPLTISIPLVVVATVLLGIAVEKIAYKPLRTAPRISVMISAIGMGINLASHKRMSFIISSFFAGISGAMLAMYQASVQATTFKSSMTYEILLIVVIGGIGSVSGSIIASFLFIASSEWLLRFLDNETWIGGFRVPLLRSGFRMVVFSIIIMAVVLFFRKGIMGDRELFQKKPASTAKAAKKEARSK